MTFYKRNTAKQGYAKKGMNQDKLISIYDNHERDSNDHINTDKLYFTLDDITQRLKYEENKNRDMLAIKYQGQIKLLLCELEFLAKIDIISLAPVTIVYAGCSPFTHGPKILQFYKDYDIKWILIDPRSIDSKCLKYKNMKYIQSLLTEELCKDISSNNENIVLISDIRASEYESIKSEDIRRDQDLNNMFIKLLNPIYSFMKFRYPFPNQYLDISVPVPNECFLQAFSKYDSTESRMLLSKVDKFITSTLEDSQEYEEKFFYYTSNIKRFKVVNKSLTDNMIGWNCKCYDCVLMFDIFAKFKFTNNLTLSLLELADFFLSSLK